MAREADRMRTDGRQDLMSGAYLYRRHALVVRITHWINAIALTLLLMSGLQIFNAHPALYWGRSSYGGEPVVLQIGAQTDATGREIGVTRLFGRDFNTTGVLGLSRESGELNERGFPAWITLPAGQWLAMGRRWHLFFAWMLVVNGAIYLVSSFLSAHIRRDLAPTREDWHSIGRSFLDHLLLRHPKGEASKRYNVLQKLSYLSVIFLLLPVMILTGCAMSPRLDSIIPGWVNLLGGRQAARTLHFFAAWALVLFALVHVFEVIVSGFWNNLRSMITGRYQVQPEKSHGD